MAFDRRETAILLLGDFLLLTASLLAALFLRNFSIPPMGYIITNLVPFLPMFLIFLATFYVSGLYEKQTRPVRSFMTMRILGAQIANAVIAALLFFLLPLTIEPKTILVLFVVVSVTAVSIWRFYRMQREVALVARTPAYLIGKGPAVDELFDEINGNDRYRIRFVAKSDTYDSNLMNPSIRVVVVDTYDPHVVATLAPLYAKQGSSRMLEFASVYEEVFDRVPFSQVGVEGVMDSLSGRHAAYDVAKRVFDILLAVVLSIIALPFILLAMVGRALAGRPVFFLHTRIGKGGKPFTLIKMSSMHLNDHGDPELQKKNYVTRFGKFLRKTRIDELPQLWNILMGDLSFIGPRPELPNIVEIYEREIPYYALRHQISPGLSGWAQIHDFDAPRGPADIERTRRKLSFDLYYLKRRSFVLDLAIALKTLRALASFTGT